MSVTDEQDMRASQIYRPLDFSKNEIRLIEFEWHEHGDIEAPLRLNLRHASLDDWNPKFVTLRNQNPSVDILKLAQAEENDIFNFEVYSCLSYSRRDWEGEKAIIFINGVATPVDKYLEVALKDVGFSDYVRYLWVEALCINHADTFDRNQHVLRKKTIFGHAWKILAWVNNKEELTDIELGYTHTDIPWKTMDLCDGFMDSGRQDLEEALGVRHRNWGAVEQQDEEIRDDVGERVFALMFDEHLGVAWRKNRKSNSGDEDRHEPEPCNVRFLDVVKSDLLTLLQKEYWSHLEVIQELTENPEQTFLVWGNWEGMPIALPVFLALGDILLKLHEHEDRVYAILDLFPPSISGAVTVDYDQDAAVTVAQFRSVVPGWNCNRLEPRSDSDDDRVCQSLTDKTMKEIRPNLT
ncbi:unnamed protein product [Clonostachys byssicola]|uniref:Heterokaryon incompatibility domain-containing protein n=1 Tax=Clonostachys byssicola TaxID=160290 RepID=A0A9N9XZU3_9HYPO|nr:unnamed protein product [Clonostachys byssicola]